MSGVPPSDDGKVELLPVGSSNSTPAAVIKIHTSTGAGDSKAEVPVLTPLVVPRSSTLNDTTGGVIPVIAEPLSPLSPPGSPGSSLEEELVTGNDTGLDVHGFAMYFFYILMFPLSLVVHLLPGPASNRRYKDLLLSLGLAVMFGLWWVMVTVYNLLDDHTRIEKGELMVPFALLFVVTIDASFTYSHSSFRVFSEKLSQEASIRNRLKDKMSLGAILSHILQKAFVSPRSSLGWKMRNRLKQLHIEVPIVPGGAISEDRLSRYTYLRYDSVAAENASVEAEIAKVHAEQAAKANANGGSGSDDLVVAEKLRATQSLGTSYETHLRNNPDRVPLESVADQIIWGVQEAYFRCDCCSCCGGGGGGGGAGSSANNADWWRRFLTLDKIPFTLISLASMTVMCALPTIYRKVLGQLADMTRLEWLEAGLYIVLMGCLSVGMVAFFFQIIDTYAGEYRRARTLTFCFSKHICQTLLLPSFDFTAYDHIIGWVAIRDYVRRFSAPLMTYYGTRLIPFVALLLAMMLSLGVLYVRDQFNQSSFTLLVITIFVYFAICLLFIILYGVGANSEMVKHRVYLLENLSQLHQRFRIEHGARAKDPDVNSSSYRQYKRTRELLIDTVQRMQETHDKVKLLEVDLDPSVVASIASLLVTAGGLVLPTLITTLSQFFK